MQVPNGDVGKLQANFWVNNLISLLNVTSSDKAQKHLICENCDSGDTAVSRCAECSVFMCDFCVKSHKRMHTFKHHQIVSLEEVKSGGPKALVKPMLCEKHQGETLKLFCQFCDKPICRDCTIIDHQGHEYLFVADAATKEKEYVKQLLDKTKAKVPILSTGVKSVEEMEKRVQMNITVVTQDIDDLKNKQFRALEETFANLKHEAKIIGQAKMKQLQAQREGLMIALASVSNSVEFTERALKDGSDVEVLSMKQQLVTNLSKLNSSIWKCKPCQEDTVQLRVNQDVWQVAGNIASVGDTHVSLEKCTVSMVGGEPGVMYDTLPEQRREFTVVSRDKHGNQKNGENIHVLVVVPGSQGPETVMKVTDNSDGTYSFSFLPQKQGCYQLTVAVSGHQIQGSPFQWQVIAPAKIPKPDQQSYWGYAAQLISRIPAVPSLTSLTRTEGVLSWKVKIINVDYQQTNVKKAMYGAVHSRAEELGVTQVQVGVTAAEIGHWVIASNGTRTERNRSKVTHFCQGFGRQRSKIQSCQDGDVFVLFLNMDTKKLIIQNLRTSETELFEGIQGTVSPYLNPDSTKYFSLDV